MGDGIILPRCICCYSACCGGFASYDMPSSTSLAHLCKSARLLHPSVHSKALAYCACIPAWFFHGRQDKQVDVHGSINLFEAFGGSKCKRLKMTIYEKLAHACWRQAYATPELYTWFLAQQADKIKVSQILFPQPVWEPRPMILCMRSSASTVAISKQHRSMSAEEVKKHRRDKLQE